MVRYGADELHKAENAIDLALHQSASLVSELTRMRLESKLSAMVGQDAVDTAVASILRLAEARRAMIETHEHLSGVKIQLGCGAVAIGTEDDKPPKGGVSPVPDIVATAA